MESADTPWRSGCDAGAGTSIDVGAVLEAESLRSDYQPIVSVRDGRIVGVEALARAWDPKSGRPIPPALLFDSAAREGLALEIDRLCRQKAAEGFRLSPVRDSSIVLFVNLNVSILSALTAAGHKLRDQMAEAGIEPGRVAIEILESSVSDAAYLRDFVDFYRGQGFLIALDDMGSGHSNLERLATIKPDIVKLDRSLIEGIDREYYKQELFDCFAKLSGRLGVSAVAEGVESLAEARACLSHGADIMQGFLVAKPGALDSEALEAALARAAEVSRAFREYEGQRIAERRDRYRRYDDIADRLGALISASGRERREELIASCLVGFPEVECAYVLDERGIQTSATVLNPARAAERRPARSAPLFSPAAAGVDQSTKSYFLYLEKGRRRYATDPYLSRASGAICVTISSALVDAEGKEIVLCLDIDSPRAN